MTHEGKTRRIRGMLANHAMFRLYRDTAALVDKFGHDNAIDYLQWQLDCVREMKEKAENFDDEELYA